MSKFALQLWKWADLILLEDKITLKYYAILVNKWMSVAVSNLQSCIVFCTQNAEAVYNETTAREVIFT